MGEGPGECVEVSSNICPWGPHMHILPEVDFSLSLVSSLWSLILPVSLEGELTPQRQALGLLFLCVPSACNRVVINEV